MSTWPKRLRDFLFGPDPEADPQAPAQTPGEFFSERFQELARLEKAQPDLAAHIEQLARRQFDQADAALATLDDKAFRLIQLCGVSSAVIATVGRRAELNDFWTAACIVAAIVLHLAAMLFAWFAQRPRCYSGTTRSLSLLQNFLERSSAYPPRFATAMQLCEAVDQMFDSQQRKARWITTAVWVWAFGLVALALGLLVSLVRGQATVLLAAARLFRL